MVTQAPPVTYQTVQLVHMDGPHKGRMDEFAQERITIGRDPSCNIVFPADARAISRLHAEITRDGARFSLVNHGRNGCFVNGKPAERAYLKAGDIIQFSEGGPKLSFLTSQSATSARSAAPVNASTTSAEPKPSIRPIVSAHRASASMPPVRTPTNVPPPPKTMVVTLQYSTHIKTFKKASVTIGREDGVDFLIKHPSVQKKHAELFSQGDGIGIRDISGTRETFVNGRSVNADTPVGNNDVITLGDQGPQLRHIGSGRFVEVIEQSEMDNPAVAAPPLEIETHKAFQESPEGKLGFIKNLFKK